MSDLFEVSAPWWHFVLRAAAMYLMVMVLIRVSGKRVMGQFTPFDLVMLILLGNAVQNGINGGDDSMTGAVIMATTLVGLNYGVAWLTARNRRAERLIEGEPVVLARNGRMFDSVLRRELVSESDFKEALRRNNVEDVQDVQLALLETNGEISVVRKERAE